MTDDTFEIIILESNMLYGCQTVKSENAIEKFVELCRDNVPETSQIKLDHTKKIICYSEQSSYHKPITIMLIGNITSDVVSVIRQLLT
jgi:hypothetical protein